MNQFEKYAFDIHLAASIVEDEPCKKEMFTGFIDEIPDVPDDYDFSLLCDNKRIQFTLTANTVIENDAYKYGNEVCIVAARHEVSGRIYAYYIDADKNEYIADHLVTMCNEGLGIYESDLPVDIVEKFPSEFYSLDIDVKNSIIDQYTTDSPHPVIEAGYKEMSVAEMKLKFKICQNTYLPDTQKVISRLFNEINSFDRDISKKSKMKLQYIMCTNTTYHPEKVDAETISAELDRNISGMTYAKGKVIDAIKSAAYCGKHGLKLLLCGPAGVGKTTFAECVAKSRNKPYHRVSCAGITTTVESQGVCDGFGSSSPGKYRRAFLEMSTTDASLILDELDKCVRDNKEHGDPTVALADMLGNGYLYDLFCEDKLTTESTWFIATCNDINKVPPHILNRFDAVVHIEPYTDEERQVIAKHHILPELAEDYGIDTELLIDFFGDEAIRYIISDFCLDYGGRDLKSNLKSIIIKVIEKLKTNDAVCPISKAEIDEILDKESVLNDPVAVYKANRHKFSPEDQKTIDRLVNDCLTKEDSNTKYRSKEMLKTIAGICRTRDIATDFNYDEFISELNHSHGDMVEVKAALARSINYLFRTGKAKNIMLVGPPGTGKTTLVLSAANATGLPFEKISCNGITSAEFIKGSPLQFANTTAGCIAKKLCNTGDYAIIMLDELDKMASNTTEGYKVISSFLDMLDEKQFQDNHLNIKLNLEKILFVATANNLSNVPAELIDRFEIVKLSGYAKSEKETIFKSHILPAVLDECACKDICFTDKAVTYMIDNYTSVSGFREIRKQVEKIIGDIVIFHPNGGYTIDISDIVKQLGKPPIERGNRPQKDTSGNVNGLSVNSTSGIGNVFSIQAVHSYTDKLTGLAQASLKESVEIARTVAENIYPDCCAKHYHIHFAEGAVAKDGPSAGLATVLAILSCEKEMIVDSQTAYTGEIDIFGNVWAVGGVPEKVEAAINAGCTRIFIPSQNYEHDSENLSKFNFDDVRIIPVSHIREVLEELNFNHIKITK